MLFKFQFRWNLFLGSLADISSRYDNLSFHEGAVAYDEKLINVFSHAEKQGGNSGTDFGESKVLPYLSKVDEFGRIIEEQKVLLAQKDAIIAQLKKQLKEQE